MVNNQDELLRFRNSFISKDKDCNPTQLNNSNNSSENYQVGNKIRASKINNLSAILVSQIFLNLTKTEIKFSCQQQSDFCF